MSNKNFTGESLPLAAKSSLRCGLVRYPFCGVRGRTPQRPCIFLQCMVFIALIFASCASMQDDVYIDSVSSSAEISAFEARFASLDAQFYEGIDSSKAKEWQKNNEKLISDIEATLKDASLKKAIVARLYAIAGCAAYDGGSKGLAKKYQEASQESFKGDARTLILANRLGLESNFSEKMQLFSDKSLLTLEVALMSYAKQNYATALAAFDEAFLSLDSFYRASYVSLRDTSWNLRSLSNDQNSRSVELLALKNLTVMQMLLVTNLEPELLYNYTAGKQVSDKELYNKVAGSGLLNPVSQPLDADNALSKNTTVTRLIAARFLWNLYNQRKNTPQNLEKYSVAYKGRKTRSPVGDVKTNSPDFDAVLGCVENEIMHLEDGIDFGAEKEVSGIEFNECVRKIK